MKASTIKKTILLGTISLAILFTSCENFLKAHDTAEQIKEAIEIANSNPTTIYIEAEKDSGTVTPSQVRVKKHETFEMKFSPSDNWKFIGWEVLDRTTMESVEDAIKFDDATKLEVKATVLKAVDNLVIKAKCLQMPAVTSVTPAASEASYANTPIKITFNMPMEAADVTAATSLFKYGAQNISILYGSVDMTEYFEAPVFNSEKTVLTIIPKGTQLLNFITLLNKPFIDIQISFGEKITVTKGDNILSLAQNNQNVSIRYKKDVENIVPVKYEFYATGKSDSETHFTQAALSTFGNTEILQNRTSETVYIHGRYYDADSGVTTIKITEKRTNAKDGSAVASTQKTTEYTTANTEFIDDGNGSVTFDIQYNLESDDGAVLIGITVIDGCNNAATEQTFTVIKDSAIDLSAVELYNFKYPFTTGGYFTAEGTENGTVIPYDDWPSIIRNVKLNPIKKLVYKNCYVSENNLKEVSLTYGSDFHLMTFDSDAEIWKFNISDDTDVTGLKITLTVEDDFEHKATKEFSFPDIPVLVNIMPHPDTKYDYDYDFTAYFSSELEFSRIISVCDVRYSETKDGPAISVDDMYEGDYPEYRRYSISSFESISISMKGIVPESYSKNGHYYYGIHSNYRFFFVNNHLAGCMTDEITVSDNKGVDSSLPAVVVKEVTENVSDDGSQLNLHITIDTDNYIPWDNYNAIMVQFAVNPTNPLYTNFIERNSTSFEITIPYSIKLYNAIHFIKLIGITDTGISPDHTYATSGQPNWYQAAIPWLEPEKYEKFNPTIETDDGTASISAYYLSEGFDIPYRYDYMIPVLGQDYQTGLKTVIINANNCIWTYAYADFFDLGSNSQGHPNHLKYKKGNQTYDAGSGYKLPFIWDADKELNNLTITYYDNYDNYSSWTGNFISAKIPSFKLKTGTNNSFESEETNGDFYQWYLGVVNFNSSTSTWNKYSELSTAPVESTGTKGGKVFTYSNISLPADQFVKIIATAALENDTMSKNFGNSVPYYFYTGSTKNSGDYDYVIKNGASKSSVLVASDAPTFVHTIVTKYPLSECQNWSVDRWEHNHKHFGDKYMTFPTENPIAKKYTIPDACMNSMDTGDCYVVIAHFADGTSAISEVMQK